jgi:hypothetical protein
MIFKNMRLCRSIPIIEYNKLKRKFKRRELLCMKSEPIMKKD